MTGTVTFPSWMLRVRSPSTAPFFLSGIAMNGFHFWGKDKLRSLIGITALRGGFVTASILAGLCWSPVCAQQADTAAPGVVQPGAPGKPTRTPAPATRATLPLRSPKDVEFMQGMIM